MRTKRMPDVEFCRRCLEIIDEVHKTRRPIVITRDLVMLIPAGKAPCASKQSRTKNIDEPHATNRRSLDPVAAAISLGMTVLESQGYS